MRVRAYVDDVEWSFAASLAPRATPSRLVQAGLVGLLADHYAAVPPSPEAKVLEARRRLAELAERVYACGYKDGLRLCAELDWERLDRLAADCWPEEALESLGIGVRGVDPDEGTDLYRTGLRDALGGVWQAALAAVEAADRLPRGRWP